jgi:FAD synthetase
VILGHVPFSFEKVIEEVKPDIVVFGYDQEDLMREFMKFVESRGLNVKVVKLGKFSSQGPSSTSELIRRAAEIMGRGSRSGLF